MQRAQADQDLRQHGNLRLLLLEDVASEAELAVRQLKSEGVVCQWRVVETEAAFRQALTDYKPSLILSDFSLPQFDGLAALRIAQEITPDTPFIFLSGTMGEERAIEALQLGAIDYVLKSNRARLVPAVKRALREAAFRNARIEIDERLRLSEERLRDIVDTSQDWIWELDADGKFVFSNDQVTTTLGMRAGELIGTYFGRYVHPADRVRVERALRSLGTERRSATQLVARWLHSDGSHRWLECNVLALLGLQGEIRGYRGADRDVTERKDQEARISRLTRVLEMLSGINGAVIRIQGRDALLQEACRLAAEVGGYALASVSLIEPGTPMARIVGHAGQAIDKLPPAQLVKIEAAINELCVAGRALHDGTVMICNDLRDADIPIPRRQELLAIGLQSLVALPLIVDDTPVGALTLSSTELAAVSEEELRLLKEVVANLSFALQYLQKDDAVRFLSYFDPLTGLARRALFCERLGRAMLRRGADAPELAIIVFDVERLSALNDSFGRYFGDALLKEIADRLKAKFEDTDQLAHLGGGIYSLMRPLERQYVDTHDQLLEQVSAVFTQPFMIEGREIRPAIRSGIAQSPADGLDANTLVQNAETALRRAKESNERFLHFDQRMNAELAARLSLEHKMRVALEQQQYVLHYQPKISFATGEIVGAEALLRWQDPETGLVAPGKFLPLLESTGMILEVGDWVFRQAAADCRRWREQGLPPLRIAVNVSWLQLRRRDFVEQVISITQPWATGEWGLDLEITESGLLQDLEGAIRKLEALRRSGLRIAIDDFGTGYSSLSRLANLPIDTLKIDRSFVSALSNDPATMTIVSSIIGLAQAFRMTSVAEGVETQEQFKLLKFMNCHESQGYLHSKPVPASEFELLLQSNKPRAAVGRS